MKTLAYYERNQEIAWRFDTARFTVALVIEDEGSDPADSFEFEEDIAAVRNGDVFWFAAGVLVFDETGDQIGADWLGACAYKSIDDFLTSHRTSPYDSRNTLAAKANNTVYCHYFPSMVAEAIRDARNTMAARKAAYQAIHA